MRFKTESLKDDWEHGDCPSERLKGWKMLKQFIQLLDLLSVLLGFGEITVTDLLRKPNPNKLSYHAVWQAGDIRSKDKPLVWKCFMVAIGTLISSVNWRFQIYPHFESWGKPNENFHIAIRIGEKG